MYWINHQPLDWNTIRLIDGKWYTGTHEIKQLLSSTLQEIKKRFFDKNEPVIFNTPGMLTAGRGKGNQGYSYPRVVRYRTKKDGPVTIAWADEKKENKDGSITYSPIAEVIKPEMRCKRLYEEDFEEILWMMLFNPFVVTPKNPTGRTFMEDKEADAVKYEATEQDAAVISYWLFRQESPFYASEAKVSTLCLAWGINPEGKTITYKKQLLAEAVKKAEKRGEIEFNLKAFNAVCERMKEGNDTKSIEVLALITQCINKKVIRFDDESFSWKFIDTDGKPMKTFCKVPPQSVGVAKGLLKTHLMTNPQDFETLQSSVSTEPTASKFDAVKVNVALPDPENMTEAFITNELDWPARKNLYKALGHDPRRATDDEIVPVLTEYFVLQGRTVSWELKPGKE